MENYFRSIPCNFIEMGTVCKKNSGFTAIQTGQPSNYNKKKPYIFSLNRVAELTSVLL